MAFSFFMRREKKAIQKKEEKKEKEVEEIQAEAGSKKPFYAFIDASNLFWGGRESMGFKIDYKKLLDLLKNKFNVDKTFYYGGIRTFDFEYSYLDNKSLDLAGLEEYLKQKSETAEEKDKLSIEKSLNKVNFYRLLEGYGYTMKIKPAKVYYDEDDENQEKPLLKANCDVDMTFDIMRLMQQYRGVAVLTGDGDFAAVLSYLKSHDREVVIVSRWDRTAKEIRQIAGDNFYDFEKFRGEIKLRY
ncbi:MAG: NYN domain-containing protein [Candidatus Berkelbacteria bacterium]|nr:NYN domain-containing protein [Candidatus Berkelbacteria bacterium]